MTLRRATAALLLLTSACSSATIYRHNAPDLEATIVGGERDYLYVETEDERLVRIARKQITDIDHPGNVEIAVGGVLTAMGVLLAAGAMASHQNGDRVDTATFGVAAGFVGIPGVLVLADGLINWSRSTHAADDRETHLRPRNPRAELWLLGAALPQSVTPVVLPAAVTSH